MDQSSISGDTDAEEVCCDEERAEPDDKALEVNLRSFTCGHELWVVT